MILFKIKTKIRRLLAKFFKFNRPSSYPFITGDGFRSISQHVFDELSNFNVFNVEKNDIIFVRSDFLEEFFIKKHPLIKNEYILISHNMDTNITEKYSKYVDDKIIHWFAQNLLFEHKKITPVPIGLTNYHYSKIMNRGQLSYITNGIVFSKSIIKDGIISFGFATSSNPNRVTLKNKLESMINVVKIEENSQLEYFKKMSKYKFTVAPDGNGIDCYRTWEALCLGVIPIVHKNSMTEYYKNIGLPIITVDDWSEIDNYNSTSLNLIYNELKDKFNNQAIYINYWLDLINSKKLI